MNSTLRFLASVVLIAALIWAARWLDRKWRAKHPEEKPFAWGYFQALCFFPAGLLWFAMPLYYGALSWSLAIAIVVYGGLGSYAGYTLIKEKKRWAWWFVVIAQLNLLTWIIDFYYGSNRWKEFR